MMLEISLIYDIYKTTLHNITKICLTYILERFTLSQFAMGKVSIDHYWVIIRNIFKLLKIL